MVKRAAVNRMSLVRAQVGELRWTFFKFSTPVNKRKLVQKKCAVSGISILILIFSADERKARPPPWRGVEKAGVPTIV